MHTNSLSQTGIELPGEDHLFQFTEYGYTTALVGPKTAPGARTVAPLGIRHYCRIGCGSAYEAWATIFMRLSR